MPSHYKEEMATQCHLHQLSEGNKNLKEQLRKVEEEHKKFRESVTDEIEKLGKSVEERVAKEVQKCVNELEGVKRSVAEITKEFSKPLEFFVAGNPSVVDDCQNGKVLWKSNKGQIHLVIEQKQTVLRRSGFFFSIIVIASAKQLQRSCTFEYKVVSVSQRTKPEGQMKRIIFQKGSSDHELCRFEESRIPKIALQYRVYQHKYDGD